MNSETLCDSSQALPIGARKAAAPVAIALENRLYERGITRVERALQLARLLLHAVQSGNRTFVGSSTAFLLADANAANQDEAREERTGDMGVDYSGDRLVGQPIGPDLRESARTCGLFVAKCVSRASSRNATRTASIKGTHTLNVHSPVVTRIDLRQ
jgi:hypothetical protein